MSDSFRRQLYLYLLVAAQSVGFVIWASLLKNFIVEDLALDGLQNAVLETVREVPGFLAFTTVFVLAYMSEQRLAVVATLILGLGVALTGYASTLSQLLAATFVSSIGFHYFHTVYKSLSLQWFDEATTPLVLGRVVSVGNGVTLVSLGLFMVLFWGGLTSYPSAYLSAGLASCLGAFVALFGFPKFQQVAMQRDRFVLRKRYWLYYLLTFLSGARRQIFIVFATFILVKIFGLSISQMLGLLLLNAAINMGTGLLLGPAILRFGERGVLQVEYLGLIFVFLAYGVLIGFAGQTWALIAVIVLYIIDHVLFQFAIAIETYFKKIADPADIQGSAAVSFTINHIAAVTLPIGLGLIYEMKTSDIGPTLVFWVGAVLAGASLASACLLPKNRA